jgi:hypothetical protein
MNAYEILIHNAHLKEIEEDGRITLRGLMCERDWLRFIFKNGLDLILKGKCRWTHLIKRQAMKTYGEVEV